MSPNQKKIGSVSFANAAPLTWGFAKDRLVSVQPSELGRLLNSGEVSAALVPTAAYLEHPEWIASPSYGIACKGKVLSVCLYHDPDVPLKVLRKIAVPKGSVSSVALLRILLKNEGANPELIPFDIGHRSPEGCDATLRIGDEALLHEEPALDLGEAWHKLTGLPFVFALWVQKKEDKDLAQELEHAAQEGLKKLDEIADLHRPRLGARAHEYFSKALVYKLGPEEQKGIAEFRRRLKELNISEKGLNKAKEPKIGHKGSSTNDLDQIYTKADHGERLTPDEGLLLFEQGDLLTLGRLAGKRRTQKTDPSTVTYIVDRNLNYSNVCVATCSICAFYRKPGHKEGYLLSWEEIDQKVGEAVDLGASQILMQGGLHPDLDKDYYLELIRRVKKFPVQLHGFSPPEIWHFANKFKMSTIDVMKEFKAVGLNSIPGGGAEILVDRVRTSVARGKCATQEWLQVMEEAHGLGIPTSATMVVGHIETLKDRIEHLTLLRDLQDRTKGFIAFIPWTFVSGPGTELKGPNKGGTEYLKTLAISRLYLDNFDHLQASWVSQSAKVGQLALSFGADDFGNVMIEEQVVASAGGLERCLSETEIRRMISEMGYAPKRRSTMYEILPDPKIEVLNCAR